MKKTIALLLLLAMAISLIACGNTEIPTFEKVEGTSDSVGGVISNGTGDKGSIIATVIYGTTQPTEAPTEENTYPTTKPSASAEVIPSDVPTENSTVPSEELTAPSDMPSIELPTDEHIEPSVDFPTLAPINPDDLIPTAPTAPTIELPTAPTMELPTAPTMELPTAPTMELPTAPTAAIPTAELPTAPTMPSMENPIEPTTPTAPTAPSEPIAPTAPSEPIAPTAPSMPTQELPTAPSADEETTIPGLSLTLNEEGNAYTLTRYTGTAKEVTIPDVYRGLPVTEIGAYAFAGNALTDVTIPDSVTEIGTSAFEACTFLTEVNLGKDSLLTRIGYGAFSHCESLAFFTFTDLLTQIGDYAFEFCSSLTGIDLPARLNGIGTGSFRGCSGLLYVLVDESNGVFRSQNNCLIFSPLQQLVLGCRNSQIPTDGSVTSIAAEAFYGCDKLEEIVIPETVKEIGAYAFYDCDKLEEITLSLRLEAVGEAAFALCTNLKTVYYGGSAANWAQITIGSQNESLLSADIVYAIEDEPSCKHEWSDWTIVPGSMSADGETTDITRTCLNGCGASETQKGVTNWSDTIK